MSEQQYFTILESLADKIKEQNDKIALQKIQIEHLERKLKAAEDYLNTVRK